MELAALRESDCLEDSSRLVKEAQYPFRVDELLCLARSSFNLVGTM
jgi:hypothetical protein